MKADEDVETYFSSFEAHMITYSAKREDWTKYPALLLEPQPNRVYISLDEDSRWDYDVVKEDLYSHFRVTQATYRSRLDKLSSNRERPPPQQEREANVWQEGGWLSVRL